MARTKINLWWIVVLLGILQGCRGKEKSSGRAVILKEAGYVYEWNDKDFYRSEPGALYRRMMPAYFGRVLRQLKPQARSSVQWIFPGENKTILMAFVYAADSLRPDSVQAVSYRQSQYYRVRQGQHQLFYFPTDSVQVWSTDAKALEKWIRQGWSLLSPTEYERVKQVRNDEAFAYWYIRPAKIYNRQWWPVDHSFLLKEAGDYWIWDVEAPGQRTYYGIGLAEGEQRRLTEVFEDTDPAALSLTGYLEAYKPYTAFFVSSFPVFTKRWEEFKKASGYRLDPFPRTRYKSLKAAAVLEQKKPVLVLYLQDASSVFKDNYPETIDGYEIYTNPDSSIIGRYFYPLFGRETYPYMARAGHKIWMATDKDQLVRLLKENEQLTPAPTPGYFEDLHVIHSTDDAFFGIRAGSEEQVWQVYGIRTAMAGQGDKTNALFLWQKDWPVAITEGPQWIYNHRSRQNEILFQDKLNRLVLMDARGKLRWKKDVDEPVLGKIYQVDMFRNGKRQFLFGTPSGIYVMDIRGVYVKPFPLHLKLTQPFGLFDYDRNRHYRIAVPQADSVVMYDIKGQRVRGFRFDKLGAPLAYAPQHLRLNGKDYIFLHQTDGKLWILDRRGRERIKVRDTITPSGKPWAVYQGAFINMDSQGRIVRLDTKGHKTYLYGGKTYADFLAGEGGLLVRKADGTLYLNGRSVDVPPASWTIEGVKRIGGKAVFWAYDAGNDRSVIIGRGKPLIMEGRITDLSAKGRPLGLVDERRISVGR